MTIPYEFLLVLRINQQTIYYNYYSKINFLPKWINNPISTRKLIIETIISKVPAAAVPTVITFQNAADEIIMTRNIINKPNILRAFLFLEFISYLIKFNLTTNIHSSSGNIKFKIIV